MTATTLRFARTHSMRRIADMGRFVSRVRDYRHRMRHATMVRELPDYLLEDIGIVREEADEAVLGG